jgi:hypothetical protein
LDVAVFGRAEGQINAIIDGDTPNNVWRKTLDPLFKKQYEIRQAQYLVSGETSCGCKKKCFFCQYSWTRKQFDGQSGYSHGKELVCPEDDWLSLSVTKPGRYTTAWDGWSESTRLAVNKNITDAHIQDKLKQILSQNLPRAVVLKIFNIIWYPWENEQTYERDTKNIHNILSHCDCEKGTRILIMFLFTPFSPEPITPMANQSANIKINTREIIDSVGRQIYKGKKIEAFVLPQINSGFVLGKRVLINRGLSGRYLKEIIKKTNNLPAQEKTKILLDMTNAKCFENLNFVDKFKTYTKIPEFKRAPIVGARAEI